MRFPLFLQSHKFWVKQRKGIEDDDAYDDYYLDIDAAMDSSPGTNCIK